MMCAKLIGPTARLAETFERNLLLDSDREAYAKVSTIAGRRPSSIDGSAAMTCYLRFKRLVRSTIL